MKRCFQQEILRIRTRAADPGIRSGWSADQDRSWPVRYSLFLCFCCLLAGCAASPGRKTGMLEAEIPIPAGYAQSDAEGDYPSPASDSETGWSWVTDFNSPELEQVVSRAMAYNYDLRSAAARLDMALATRSIAGAGRFPSVNGFGGMSRNKRSSRDEFSALRASTIDIFNLGFNWNWELDLWGRLRNEKQSAIASAEAAEAEFRGARLSIAGNVVRSWLELREALAQEQLARETLANFRNNLDVVIRGYADGIYSAVDVSLIRANVESAVSQLESRVLAAGNARRQLQILLGEYPDSDVDAESSLPELSAPVPPGLPSELLNRRPDLVAAERTLASALENRKVARKSFLPQIRLTGNYGVNSQELGTLLDPASVAWTVAENFTLPIFQGGRLWGTWNLRKAEVRMAFAEYARTALQAFLEVESALQSEQSLRDQSTALANAARENEMAADLAWKDYERGVSDSVVTVLEAQRRAFSTQSQYLLTRRLYLQNRVALHLALGGPFDFPLSQEDVTEGSAGSEELLIEDPPANG